MNIVDVAIKGAMLNSGLYLAGVFVAGITTANDIAWKIDIAAIGLTYLSYLAMMPRWRNRDDIPFDPTPEIVTPPWQVAAQPILVWMSIIAGAAAGIALLF